MPAAVRGRRPASGCEDAARLVAVGEEEDRDERARRPLRGGDVGGELALTAAARSPSCPARRRAQPDLHRGCERVADRRPAEAVEVVRPRRSPRQTSSWSVVGGVATCASPAKSDEPDLEARRHLVEERVHRPLRGGEPRRLDVDRLHRAGDVEHEDDRRVVARDQRRARAAARPRRRAPRARAGRRRPRPSAATARRAATTAASTSTFVYRTAYCIRRRATRAGRATIPSGITSSVSSRSGWPKLIAARTRRSSWTTARHTAARRAPSRATRAVADALRRTHGADRGRAAGGVSPKKPIACVAPTSRSLRRAARAVSRRVRRAHGER